MGDLMRENDRRLVEMDPDDPRFDEFFDAVWGEALEHVCHPNVEWVNYGQHFVGLAGLREMLKDILTAMDRFERDQVEVIEVDSDVVVGRLEVALAGRGSGVAVDGIAWIVWQCESGLLRRSESHTEREAAFASAEAAAKGA